MDSNKKRKLNGSDRSPLSAFAARQVLKSQSRITSKASINGSNDSMPKEATNTPNAAAQMRLKGNTKSLSETTSLAEPIVDSVHSESPTERLLNVEDEGEVSSFSSPGEFPDIPVERPKVVLSTFKPTQENFEELADGTLSIKMAPGERLVVLGQYEICILQGRITLMGATIQASKRCYQIFASSSHALPVMRCPGSALDGAKIRLQQCKTALASLKSLSPLFGKLWNDESGPLGFEDSPFTRRTKRSTFQILFSSGEVPLKAYLQPLISPPRWNEVLAACLTRHPEKARMTMICGPKSSGKSTFAKLLSNKLLSSFVELSGEIDTISRTGVALLEIDPGQPEYSPPGQLSLMHLQELNLGPPFTHPVPWGKNRVIRSHSIGAISPSLDPTLYMACVTDLFAHYQNLLSIEPNCPLIINTPGWVLGTGLEILVELIANIRPTEIIYMSEDGPLEVVESLKEASKSAPLFTLPSQVSEYATRTAAHLRTMQSMSYFHIDSQRGNTLDWNSLPLTSIPPWEIRYSGENPGILGIMSYGEQPSASLLADAVNGSLVSIIVLDDMAAISDGESLEQETGDVEDEDIRNDVTPPDSEIWAFDRENQSRRFEKPLIVSTPREQIPYFNPLNAISLDPKHSHSLGLGLVRGIDGARRRLQLLTPISPKVIEKANELGKSIVLISGKLDTPGWAFIEQLNQESFLEKTAMKERGDAMDIEEEEDDEYSEMDDSLNRSHGDRFQKVPWVERLHGSQGRGVGARVWRVRRDLGRIGDGGD